MRFVLVGAGAIGGVVGGYLWRAGADVAFVARGEHGRVIDAEGLTVRTREGEFVVDAAVAPTPAALGLVPDDVVLLCVKSQDTAGVLDALAEAGADPALPIACLQNGVCNEPLVASRFVNTYGVVVMAPTLHLEPGIVEAKAGPVPALLDIGRYPDGVDATAQAISDAFNAAGMDSIVLPDVMRWKWTKLLMNLGNAIEVVCGSSARYGSDLARAVNREGRAVLDAAGIAYASSDENRERRGELLQTDGNRAGGGSSWQSVSRGAPVETDYLTGEIVSLGAQIGVPTPVNSVLLRRAAEVARAGAGPGSTNPDDILAEAAPPS